MKMEEMKGVMETTMQAVGRKPSGHDERKGFGNYWEIEQGNEFFAIVGCVKDKLAEHCKELPPFQWRKLSSTQWRGWFRDDESVVWINIVLCVNQNRSLRTYVEFCYLEADREDFIDSIEELGI